MVNPIASSGQIPFDIIGIVRPLATVTIYPYGIMLRKANEHGVTQEYPVSPSALAGALAANVQFETGLLPGNTVYVGQRGSARIVVEYRPPEIVGLFLEGSEKPLRVPMPGLLMRRLVAGTSSSYRICAVKQRPLLNDEPLFMAPLPNVGRDGTCWGTVARPADVSGTSLAEDWRMFMGSVFGNHNLIDKSKRYSKDIRKMLLFLDEKGRKKYPVSDLRPLKNTVADLFKWSNGGGRDEALPV